MKFAATIALIVFSIIYSFISAKSAEPPAIWLLGGCDDNRGRIRAVNTGDDMPVATEWTMRQGNTEGSGTLQLNADEAHDWWLHTATTITYEGRTMTVGQCGHTAFLPAVFLPGGWRPD